MVKSNSMYSMQLEPGGAFIMDESEIGPDSLGKSEIIPYTCFLRKETE
jgi:hypothetical protein